MSSPILWGPTGATSLQSALILPGSTSGNLTLQPNAVTTSYSFAFPAAQAASASVLGNDGSGNGSWLSYTTLTADLNLFTSTLQGLTPASGGGTANFLRADGTWAAPGGSSPLTTKGDLYTYTSTNARHPVPADYGYIISDAQQSDNWRNATYTMIAGRPGKNYIQYADIENNATTGWTLGTIGTLTNGLPTGSPTFGSGASGNLSIAATSSSIEGVYSLNYVSSAATTQGNMVASSSYAIDSCDQAKVLTIRFYYTPVSGTSNCNFSGTSSNSFAWAIYDVTNSSWLVSQGNFNLVQGSGVGLVTGTCQTNATTANIRLCIYNANATSGAVTLTLDGFYVGPSGNSIATSDVGSVSASYYASANGTSSSSASINFDAKIFDTHAAVSASTPGTGTWKFTAPVSGNYTVSSFLYTATSSGAYLNVYKNGTNLLTLSGSGDSSLRPYEASVAISLNAGDYIDLRTSNSQTWQGGALNAGGTAIISIVGSPNPSTSADTDVRVTAARMTGATATVTGSYSDVTWTTIVSDTNGAMGAINYTIPVSGYYNFTGGLYASATTIATGNIFGVALYNTTSSTVILESDIAYEGTSTTSQSVPFAFSSVFLSAGTQIKIQVKSSTSSPVITSSATYNHFEIFRTSGPAVPQAVESVNARYHSATASLSGSFSAVTYTTKDFDTHNAYSGSTYTVPISGKYQVNIALQVSGGSVSCSIAVFKNGSQYNLINEGTVSTQVQSVGSDIIQCNAGDTLQIQGAGGGSPSVTGSSTANYFSICRVGN